MALVRSRDYGRRLKGIGGELMRRLLLVAIVQCFSTKMRFLCGESPHQVQYDDNNHFSIHVSISYWIPLVGCRIFLSYREICPFLFYLYFVI
jgi:hypothetical protein